MAFKKAIAFVMMLAITFSISAYAIEQPKEQQPPQPQQPVDGLPTLKVNAKAALLMEPVTGRILLEQNSHDRLPPASVTKVMTMLIIFESVEQGKIAWDDMVTTSEHAAGMGGSQVYLETMEQQTVRDLTKAIVISSGNDAAVAMSEFIAGSEDGFVTMMNSRAKELGMLDTNFVNACGLDDPNHLTSAYDISVMTRELITKHPKVFEFSTIWMDKIVHKTARGVEDFGLSNTNRLLKSYPAATGLKTGSTSAALYCISATAEKNGLQLNAVVLGAPDPTTRFGEAIKMMDYGFANYAMASGDAAGTVLGEVAVVKGNVEKVQVKVGSQVNALIPKGKSAELTKAIELSTSLPAPFPEGAKAGQAVYYYEGNEVGKCDLVTAAAVSRANLGDTMSRMLRKWFR
ncbi:MAG: D-alanyl-D-alanine carboxypeptidase [Clostridiales bacterium]|jgi:D-alanyl-D-alanine carboxypeptidase (penicillin-binding protein 5/6)|nr:D-alanyl-D-alanine carboxypeptidase [Clostridiales bacterium]MDR2750958.1 D-alanyl-D-alanine carboxypeptidase [Clostridiales bacterium]